MGPPPGVYQHAMMQNRQMMASQQMMANHQMHMQPRMPSPGQSTSTSYGNLAVQIAPATQAPPSDARLGAYGIENGAAAGSRDGVKASGETEAERLHAEEERRAEQRRRAAQQANSQSTLALMNLSFPRSAEELFDELILNALDHQRDGAEAAAILAGAEDGVALQPTDLSFAVAAPGEQQLRTLRVLNQSKAPILLRAIRFLPADGGFSMLNPPPPAGTLVTAGDVWELELMADAPTEVGVH